MSEIRLSQSALKYNISILMEKAPIHKLFFVLKDNAYGHGIKEYGSMCLQNGIKNVVVRDTEEALLVSDMFETILVLAEKTNFLKHDNIHYAINSFSQIHKIHPATNVHLKIDTGMHRNGINPSELQEALELIFSKSLRLRGVFSHLKSGDELGSQSFWQEQCFKDIKNSVIAYCEAKKVVRPLFHLYNSAGLFRANGIGEFDAARIGIAAYGYLDMPSVFNPPKLKPVLSLWGDKIASRDAKVGERIGYGGIALIEQGGKISTYDVGYGDGFFRISVNGSCILPGGRKMIGKVCMDCIFVDSEDDSICVFDDALTLANRYKTIPYEILVRLNHKIARRITP